MAREATLDHSPRVTRNSHFSRLLGRCADPGGEFMLGGRGEHTPLSPGTLGSSAAVGTEGGG